MLYTRNAIIILICEGHRLVTRVYISFMHIVYIMYYTPIAPRCV